MDKKSLVLRKNKLVELMKKSNVKSVMLSPSMNMFYLTGFNTFPGERLLVSIFDDCGKVTFVVPKLYEQEVREKAVFDQLLPWDDSENPVSLLEAVKGANDYNSYTIGCFVYL
jgi:Xaa-Pro dipeptidase